MAKNKEKKKYIQKLRNKYRLVIMNDSTFEEVLTYRLSRLNVFTMAGFIIIILLALGILLIALTPLREFIPNYPDGNMRRNITINALMIDSLENELRVRDQYLENLKNIMNGKDTRMHELIKDTDIHLEDSVLHENYNDSSFIAQFEEDEYYSPIAEFPEEQQNMSRIFFYSPVKGLITNTFNAEENHFGVDLVAAPEEAILSVLEGTVIISSWTLETGNIIQIQHDNDLISVYKHNSQLLKTTGNHVKAGEPVAIIGNSGELSTGPHLHFELWHKGRPIDPEEYIKF